VFTHARPQSVLPAAHTHAPAVHVWPAAQAVPQAPQFIALLCSSTHVGAGAIGAQSVCPAAHMGRAEAQRPAMQLCPAAQAVPHAPQLAGSESSVAQPIPQRVWPMGHIAVPVHIPAPHVWPIAQVRPQAPQFKLSVAVSTHVPLQFVCPAGHIIIELPQRPAVQTWPAEQTVPHAPQFIVSVCVLVQTPLQRVSPPPHGACPSIGGGGVTPESVRASTRASTRGRFISGTAHPATTTAVTAQHQRTRCNIVRLT
jgi:hypothetical protein